MFFFDLSKRPSTSTSHTLNISFAVSPEALEPMSRTLTLDNSKVKEATGIEFFDTLSVISREEKNYPYDIK